MSNRMLRTSLDCQVREIDDEKREATFVASTERAVSVGPWEPEVLRMKGARLARYKKNPVVLDTHNRFDLDHVIGSAEATVVDRKLIARVRYAKTPAGERAWQLVKDGHVRAMSIGYSVNPKKVRRLREGESDGEGESLIKGPASIVDDWELHEISNVPVPADEDAVRRAFYQELRGRKAPHVAHPKKNEKRKGVDFAQALNILAASQLAQVAGQRADSDPEDEAADSDETKADAEVTCPECNHTFTPERAEGDDEEVMDSGGEEPRAADEEVVDTSSDAKKSKPAGASRASASLSKRELLKRQIYEITPRGLEHVAGESLLESRTLDEHRAALKRAWAARHKPLGTLEAGEIDQLDKKNRKGKDDLDKLSDDDLVRSLENLTG